MIHGFDTMFNFGIGGGILFLVFNLIKLIIIVAGVIIVAKLITKSTGNTHIGNESNRAIEILKERYAKGEIDEDEYNNKLKKLKD